MTAARAAAVLVALLALAGCAPAPQPRFHAEGAPPRLSEWGMLDIVDGRLAPAEGVLPYELATPLFTDYAQKLRTVWMPAGTRARFHPHESFAFPVGTVITKTFFYLRDDAEGGQLRWVRTTEAQAAAPLDLAQVRLLETRVLVHREQGWVAMPYVWNAEQTEAVLSRAGAAIPLELHDQNGGVLPFTYVVPDQNQCAGCHATDNTRRALLPIGPKARHLNIPVHYADGAAGQLQRWVEHGLLQGLPEPAAIPPAVRWDDATAPVAARARAYLDINCGHCHHPRGAADTSGMWLDALTSEPRRLGVCKPPVAAGQGTGDHLYGIVPGKPRESILAFRLLSTDPGAMMPELGRSTAHREGGALIDAWIGSMPGDCGITASEVASGMR